MSQTNPPPPTNGTNDPEKTKLGFWVVIVGILIAAGLFLAAVYKYSAASDVATSLGPITTLIGTLVGAFFGQQVGSAGKAQAQKNNIKLAAAAAAHDRMTVDQIVKLVE